jgi:hypothetical protein
MKIKHIFVLYSSVNFTGFEIITEHGKGKALPVTSRGGSQVYETSRLLHFLDNRLTDVNEVVSPLLPGRFPVLISVEPGLQCGWKE